MLLAATGTFKGLSAHRPQRRGKNWHSWAKSCPFWHSWAFMCYHRPTTPITHQLLTDTLYNLLGRDGISAECQLPREGTRVSHGFIPVANVASIEMIYSLNGVTAENVFHIHKGSPYSLADLQAARTIVNNWDAATWLAVRGSPCTLNRIRSKALDSAVAPIEDFSLPTPRAGTNPGSTLPGNSTWCVKLATGLTGRSFRGRLYIVGLCINALSGNPNIMSATIAPFYITWLNQLLTNLAAGGHTLGVVSYRSNHIYRAAGVFTPATGFVSVDLNVDSMRRRLTGRGL